MKLEKVNIQDLNPADYNPRHKLTPDDPEYQSIKNSIETFGRVVPLVVNKDLVVISGHQRLQVLKDLGDTEVDVVILDVDKDNERILNVALNKITGRWDEVKLKTLMRDLQKSVDPTITGFTPEEIQGLVTEIDTDQFFKAPSDGAKEKKPVYITCPKCGKEFEK